MQTKNYALILEKNRFYIIDEYDDTFNNIV